MKYVCYTMILLIMLYFAKAKKVNHELETIQKDYLDDPCYNSSDRAQTIKWASDYNKDMINFDSEFEKVLWGNKTNYYYIAAKLFGNRATSDRTVIAKFDESFNNCIWNFSKVESSMPGSFMCVDEVEANLYLYHKETSPLKNQIITLDPAGGTSIRVKLIALKEDFEMTSSEARSNNTLYFSTMSGIQAYLCKDRPHDVTIKCSVIPFLDLNSNVLNSIDIMHSIQTVFNDTSIILSVSTSYNYLNSAIITFDQDLNQISNSVIHVTNLTSPVTSIKLMTVGDILVYFLTDNSNTIKVLSVYPNQTYDLWQFKIFEDDTYNTITTINDAIKEYCVELSLTGIDISQCYFTLVYDYIGRAKSEKLDSVKSSSNRLNQQSYSRLFRIGITGKRNAKQEYYINLYASNYEDKFLKKKLKTIVSRKDNNSLYFAGSFTNYTSNDSWYLKVNLDQNYHKLNLLMFNMTFLDAEKISSGIFTHISSINKTRIDLNTYEQDIEKSTFNSFIEPQNYLLSPYSFNETQGYLKILKNPEKNALSNNATLTLPLLCNNTNYNYTLKDYCYYTKVETSVYPFGDSDLYCDDYGYCTINRDIFGNLVTNENASFFYDIYINNVDNETVDSYSKYFEITLVSCVVEECLKCNPNNMRTCVLCKQNYVSKENQCQQIYDQRTIKTMMVCIMGFTYFLIAVCIFISIFKPRLWILVVLIFENIQIIALLAFTNSFHYAIYKFYAALILLSPGFFSFLYDINIFDRYSYIPYQAISIRSILEDIHQSDIYYTYRYQNALISTLYILFVVSVPMMMLMMIFIKCQRVFKAFIKIYGYLLFRLFNIIMLPTFIISLVVFKLHSLGDINIKGYNMIIYILYFCIVVCYYLLQVRSLIYSIFIPSSSILLITTSIDNRFELPARLYQVILAMKKFIFAILIFYGRNMNQVLIYSLFSLVQILWLTYCIKVSPLKYRFANIVNWVNETTLTALFLLTLFKEVNLIQRDSYYVYVQIMLRFPLGAIFIILYYFANKIEKGCFRRIRLRLFPYKFRFIGLQKLEVDDQFGKFQEYEEDSSQNKTQNQVNSISKNKKFITEKRSSIN